MQIRTMACASEGVAASAREAESRFGPAIAAALESLHVRSLDEICFSPVIVDPGAGSIANRVHTPRNDRRATLLVNIPFEKWLHGSTTDRLDLLATVLAAGVREIDANSLSADEAEMLLTAVEQTRRMLTQRDLPPSLMVDLSAHHVSSTMFTLYKREGDELLYHEAWSAGEVIVEHWGKVGERGRVAEHALSKTTSVEDQLRLILQGASGTGFAPIDAEDLFRFVIEYRIEESRCAALDRRHQLEDRLIETLGWTGLGKCDGGDSSGDEMAVHCRVVDVDIARRVVAVDLQETEFKNYVGMYSPDTE